MKCAHLIDLGFYQNQILANFKVSSLARMEAYLYNINNIQAANKVCIVLFKVLEK